MPAQPRNIAPPEEIPPLPLKLDNHPLQILDGDESPENITPAIGIGIATVLYNWTPGALWAFLDTKSWLTMTWNLTLHHGQPEQVKFEIGRIRTQITFGKLDREGLWEVMITYDMPEDGGAWTANTEETMVGENNVEDVGQVLRLAGSFMRELLRLKPWTAGSKTKHQFFVEAMDAPMDPFEDGLAIDPRWLYKALDLSRCTACSAEGERGLPLSRCGRCGTAAYCSGDCQRNDWSVHRAICTLPVVERGKALHLSSEGGLVNYDWSQGVNIDEADDNTIDD